MSTTSSAPIGVFDSGLGGLSVLKAIRTALPNEHLMYVADSAYAPYGERDAGFVIDRTLVVSDFLLQAKAKCIVVACNTATALAIEALRQHCSLPIIAIEPAVKPAVTSSQNKIIGVLATRATIASVAFTQLCERYRGDTRLLLQPCPGLVEQVEKGELDSATTRALLRHYIQPLLDAGADTLVLGCTH
ncbi:MAG: glutamate racemase, partial [Burkholderiaceae bacterium]|nr:glutamate racemase [Burkholderiaceae bacterium]